MNLLVRQVWIGRQVFWGICRGDQVLVTCANCARCLEVLEGLT